MKKRKFGKNKATKETNLYIFENANGMKMEVTDLGATLVRLLVPDKRVCSGLLFLAMMEHGNMKMVREHFLVQLLEETRTE